MANGVQVDKATDFAHTRPETIPMPVLFDRYLPRKQGKRYKERIMSILPLMILLLAAAIGIWAAVALVSALVRAGGFRALFAAWRSALGKDEKEKKKSGF